jgi:hypothetical protein
MGMVEIETSRAADIHQWKSTAVGPKRTLMTRGPPDTTAVNIGHKARDWTSWGLKFEVIFLFGSSSDCSLPDFWAYSFEVFR